MRYYYGNVTSDDANFTGFTYEVPVNLSSLNFDNYSFKTSDKPSYGLGSVTNVLVFCATLTVVKHDLFVQWWNRQSRHEIHSRTFADRYGSQLILSHCARYPLSRTC